jgi:tetratricopeptide (TPR) repeat protein
VPFYITRGEVQTARELGEQLLNLAQRVHEPARLADAHISLGNALFHLGEWGAARTHLEQGLAHYQPQQHRSPSRMRTTDIGVFGLARLGQSLWRLGYADQALQQSQEALTLARELVHPYSVAAALNFATEIHCCRREGDMTYELAEAALVLSREQGFTLRMAEATIQRGWALVEQGQGEAGIAQIRQGRAAQLATGMENMNLSTLLAEAFWKVGQGEEGLRVVAEALTSANSSEGGRQRAELYRLQGELLLTLSSEHPAEAETCFGQALEVARRQQAKSLELRAAMSLSRLWQRQGKLAEALELLAPVYGWFTEGFDTADLQEAKALLEELS